MRKFNITLEDGTVHQVIVEEVTEIVQPGEAVGGDTEQDGGESEPEEPEQVDGQGGDGSNETE